MRISFWCDTCQKELDWGYVSKEDSLILNSIPKAYTHIKKGHEVFIRDKDNVELECATPTQESISNG